MSFFDLVVGKPLATTEERADRKQVSRTTVRPWCHLFLRQQTWQEIENLVAGGL